MQSAKANVALFTEIKQDHTMAFVISHNGDKSRQNIVWAFDQNYRGAHNAGPLPHRKAFDGEIGEHLSQKIRILFVQHSCPS